MRKENPFTKKTGEFFSKKKYFVVKKQKIVNEYLENLEKTSRYRGSNRPTHAIYKSLILQTLLKRQKQFQEKEKTPTIE